MTKVYVIIPYYQREAGVLRRALDSIYAQVLDREVSVITIVVDDESPAPVEPETAGLERNNFSLIVLKRRNGGPAKARNTGLEAAVDADVIAFLDSDDIWGPNHLAAGLAALRAGSQLYFANIYYDDERDWFSGLNTFQELLSRSNGGGNGVYRVSRDTALQFFLVECVAHTSSIILDAKRIEGQRFDESLLTCGEDHLFWIASIAQSDFISFSTEPMVARGRGLDLYRRALDWNSPECVRRLYFALMLQKKMLERFCRTAFEKKRMLSAMNRMRRGILYLLVRNAFRHVSTNGDVWMKLLRTDDGFLLNLPQNAFIAANQKLMGKLDFPTG
jgi:succinoglycan biosynthesis protein ExoW